jgi:cytochrome b
VVVVAFVVVGLHWGFRGLTDARLTSASKRFTMSSREVSIFSSSLDQRDVGLWRVGCRHSH